jgi:hypothetical protein
MNSILKLSGKDYELRFDIVALTSAHNLVKSLGYKRENVWSLGDTPFDLGEEVILVAHGINGAKRLSKDKNTVTIEEVQEMFQEHFDYIAEKVQAIEDEKEALETFQEEHNKVMTSIGEAVRAGLGFRRGAIKGGSKRQTDRVES